MQKFIAEKRSAINAQASCSYGDLFSADFVALFDAARESELTRVN
jgi:hypothetical protein